MTFKTFCSLLVDYPHLDNALTGYREQLFQFLKHNSLLKSEITAEEAVSFLVEKGWRVENNRELAIYKAKGGSGLFHVQRSYIIPPEKEYVRLKEALPYFLEDWQPPLEPTVSALVTNVNTVFDDHCAGQAISLEISSKETPLRGKTGTLSTEAARKIFEILKEDLK